MDFQEVGCVGVDLIELVQDKVAVTLECGNVHSGSIKYGEFLDKLKTGQLLKKGSAVWSEDNMSKTIQISRKTERFINTNLNRLSSKVPFIILRYF